MRGVFAQAWPPLCRFFLLLPLPPSPFQADPLEGGGSLSLLTYLGFCDPGEREPKVGHPPLFTRAPAALHRWCKCLVSGLYWLSVETKEYSLFFSSIFSPLSHYSILP